MNVKQFLSILIKVLGLFLLVKVILIFPDVFAFAISSIKNIQHFLPIFLSQFVLLVFYCLFVYWGIFKSDRIADKLLKEEMKSETVMAFKIHRSVILSMAIIVAGLFIFISELPDFVSKFCNYFLNDQFKDKVLTKQAAIQLLSSAIKLLIGFILFSKSAFWVKVIEKRRK